MFIRVLTDIEVKKFSELTGVKSTRVLISKGKKYYYATIVDESIKVRISKDLANVFV